MYIGLRRFRDSTCVSIVMRRSESPAQRGGKYVSAQIGYGVGRPLVLRPFLAPGRGSLVVPDHAVAVMMMVMEQPVIEVVSVLMVVMPVVMVVFMARVRAPAFSPSVVVKKNISQ